MIVRGQSCPEAEDSCQGLGGGDLCNDRCKACKYNRGECGGSLWQVCQCFRSRAEMIEARRHDAVMRRMEKQLNVLCPDHPEMCHGQCKSDGQSYGRCKGSDCVCE